MKYLYGFLIFCIILFLYLHFQFHLKKSDDLEIYEIENITKDKLHEICDIRQPVLFNLESEKLINNSKLDSIVSNYNHFEIKLRNISEKNPNEELYVPLELNTTIELFKKDKECVYFSEKNDDFIQETGLIKYFQYSDEYIRPYMVSNCMYDIMFGSNETTTPFRYNVNYRNYFMTTQGIAKIKLSPPKSSKYLNPSYDYELFEFKSDLNPWKVDKKDKSNFNRIKCLEVSLTPGKMIFVPAYWWYSIQFFNNASVSCFYYKTYMNNFAILPLYFMRFLQTQNTKREIANKVELMNNNPNENTTEKSNEKTNEKSKEKIKNKKRDIKTI